MQELAASQLWMNGPAWLKDGELGGLLDTQMPMECCAEMKCGKLETTHGLLTLTDPPGIEQFRRCTSSSAVSNCTCVEVLLHPIEQSSL